MTNETIAIRSEMPFDLNYELMFRTKKQDFRKHKLTKADLIIIACRYFLDSYENPESENGEGMQETYLELVGKASA